MQTGMSAESTSNEPNEFGFSGDGTAPQPTRDAADRPDGEDVAVPAGDLTGSITDGIDDMTHDDDTRR